MNVRSELPSDPLQEAVARLDGAMTRVERVAGRMRARVERAETAADQARNADDDRARLAEALDVSRGREAALHQAAQEASDALDRAIEELRTLAADEA
jgi:ABC-type transporter Mla subunit MlaD